MLTIPNRFIGFSALCAILLVLTSGGCATDSFSAKRSVVRAVAHVEDSFLEVSSRNGAVDVSVDPTLAEVEIVAEFRASGATQEEADARLMTMVIQIERVNGRLLILPKVDGNWHPNDGCNFTIRLPQTDGVSVNTRNGRVTLRNTRGQATVATSNGSIDVDGHVGPMTLESSNGSIHVVDATDTVRTQTSNGNVKISLIDEAVGPVDVVTSNGSVSLTVGSAFTADLDVATSNGHVEYYDADGVERLRSKSNRVTIRVGEGGQPGSVRTTNGEVTIRHRSVR